MTWWKMKWLKSKNRAASRNGADKSRASMTAQRPAVQQLAESIDPRRLLIWILGVAAATAVFVYRWNKRYPDGAPSPADGASGMTPSDFIDADAEPTQPPHGPKAFLSAIIDLAGRARTLLGRKGKGARTE